MSHMPVIMKWEVSVRQLQQRINLNYRPMSRLSMDLKVLPKSYWGQKYILCITDASEIIRQDKLSYDDPIHRPSPKPIESPTQISPKKILCITDEVTNYLITLPIHQSRSEEIADALIDNVIDWLIMF